jgi:mannitol-specific phosphotransferase system IIBC component
LARPDFLVRFLRASVATESARRTKSEKRKKEKSEKRKKKEKNKKEKNKKEKKKKNAEFAERGVGASCEGAPAAVRRGGSVSE